MRSFKTLLLATIAMSASLVGATGAGAGQQDAPPPPMLGEHKGARWRLTEAERATIAARWQGYFDRFGYDPASGRPF